MDNQYCSLENKFLEEDPELTYRKQNRSLYMDYGLEETRLQMNILFLEVQE